MIYRMRTYRGVKEHLATFTSFFTEHLLPVQLRHGARLVGRWQTEDDRIVAVWEYDSRDAFNRIQSAVAQDPASTRARSLRKSLPRLYDSMEEVFMESTV